jgi:hypothetical protein
MRFIPPDPREATFLDVDLNPAVQAAENARRLVTLVSDRSGVVVVGHFLLLFAGHHAIRGHRPEEMTDIISRLDDTHHLFFQQADCHAGLARRGEPLPTVICALATLARVLDWRVALARTGSLASVSTFCAAAADHPSKR